MSTAARDLELLVAKIQKELAPAAKVEHNVKLPGKFSKRSRQIDVLLTQSIGQLEIKVVLEAKDRSRPVDVKGVEEFHGLLDDVGAHKGAMVSPSGFSAAAKARAEVYGIDLYSPVDTDPHKWTAKPSIPVMLDYRVLKFSVQISCSAPVPFKIDPDFVSNLVVMGPDEMDLGTCEQAIRNMWERGSIPLEVGTHPDIQIFPVSTFVDNGYGSQTPVNLTAIAMVDQYFMFGWLPIVQVSGFEDVSSGGIVSKGFTTDAFDVDEAIASWQLIADRADAPVEPVLTIQASGAQPPRRPASDS